MDEDRFPILCLNLGYVCGALSEKATRDQVVASIKAKGLNPLYIKALRDYLDEILNRP